MNVNTYQVIGITPPTSEGREPTGGILALDDPDQGEFDLSSSRVHLGGGTGEPSLSAHKERLSRRRGQEVRDGGA